MKIANVYRWLFVLLVLTGCGALPTEPDYAFGRVDVYVLDTASQPVNGVTVRLVRTNGQIEDAGGATGSAGPPGYYFFLKTGGEYQIEIGSPPSGYVLAPGQTGTTRITFTRNQTQTLTFLLQRV